MSGHETRSGGYKATFFIQLSAGKRPFAFPCVAFDGLGRYVVRNVSPRQFIYVTGRFTSTLERTMFYKGPKDSRIAKKKIHWPILTLAEVRLFKSLPKTEDNEEYDRQWHPNYLALPASKRTRHIGAAVNIGTEESPEIISSIVFADENEYVEAEKPPFHAQSSVEVFDFSQDGDETK